MLRPRTVPIWLWATNPLIVLVFLMTPSWSTRIEASLCGAHVRGRTWSARGALVCLVGAVVGLTLNLPFWAAAVLLVGGVFALWIARPVVVSQAKDGLVWVAVGEPFRQSLPRISTSAPDIDEP